MKIGVPKESAAGERRVALVPDTVRRLAADGVAVAVEHGAGAAAHLGDAAYAEAGAEITDDPWAGVDVVAKVRPPTDEEAERVPSGAVLICLLGGADEQVLSRLAADGVKVLGLERVPRITRAQSMDVLSSQSTVAGYRAALIAATELGRFLPMLTTAAGTVAPAKAFVIGAGVAGLQAIATLRRLGAVVSAFDIRPAAAEQVRSLGATFVESEAVDESAETTGGYARAQSEDEQARTAATLARHIRDQDLVVTTAQIPGRTAPRLISEEMVASMRPGSVIVDLAAETGGNCALTRAGETVDVDGVRVVGPENLPSTLAQHASQMFSRNLLTLLKHLIQDGELVIDPDDEITGAMLVVPDGEVRT